LNQQASIEDEEMQVESDDGAETGKYEGMNEEQLV
jgi:hypothetical protein